MKGFQVSDLWGFFGAALFLILVYLLLNNWTGTNAILNTTFSGTNSLFQTLQGR
ncbi:MAG: hypothetical protein K6T26_07510 [Alicyclobacillus sp.]|nr:hypothetical protein [Alicyclobacillus sp.]